MSDPVITVYHDTRRKKGGNRYPVKLRVYHSYKTRYYLTGVDLTEQQFKDSYLAEKPKGKESRELKEDIISKQARALAIAKDLKKFDFARFEKRLLNKVADANDVVFHFHETIAQLRKDERIKTAISYECSLKSIQQFLKSKDQKPTKDTADKKTYPLPFSFVTKDFLNEYERWMISEGNSTATVGIYLRPVRAIFNTAIRAGEIDKDLYPFTRDKYRIPGGRKIKKALTKADLKKLYEYQAPDGSPMKKAKDFWFFSYQASGINIRDIAELKEKNVKGGKIIFIRSKTKRTTKADPKPIVVSVNPFLQSVIDTYGNTNRHKDSYVFPIYSHAMDAVAKADAVNNFNRFVNQHIKRLAKLAKIDSDISNMHARHSFATVAIQSGASKELVQEQLGHTHASTTENYFKGFEESTRKKIEDVLMNFD